MSIPSISDQTITQSPSPNKSFLDSFPIDVAAHIFSFAGPRFTTTCTTLSTQSSEDAVECARITMQGELNRFIKYVKVTLRDANITNQLDRIELLSAHKFPNLLSLKTTVFDIQYDILNVLQNLTGEQSLLLRNVPKLTFCDDIIRMAEIRKKYLNHKSLTLQEYNELFNAGDLRKAYEIVTHQKYEPIFPIFEEIFKGLLRTNGFLLPGNPNTLSNKEDLNDAIQMVSEEQLKQGNFLKAIQALNMIPNREVREERLRKLCQTFAERGQLDWAIKTAKNIRNKVVYSIAVRAICIELTKKGKVREAISLANTLLKDLPRDIFTALTEISQTLTKIEQLSAAFTIAMSIKDKQACSNALYSLSTYLVATGQILQPTTLRNDSMARLSALDAAKSIPDDLTRDTAYLDICTSLAGEKKFPESIEIADKISDIRKKDKAWLTISQEMLKDLELSFSAGQIATRIQNSTTKRETLQKICKLLVEKGRLDMALAVANLIPEEAARQVAINLISSQQKR